MKEIFLESEISVHHKAFHLFLQWTAPLQKVLGQITLLQFRNDNLMLPLSSLKHLLGKSVSFHNHFSSRECAQEYENNIFFIGSLIGTLHCKSLSFQKLWNCLSPVSINKQISSFTFEP